MLGPLRKEWLAGSVDQPDSRNIVIGTDCEERPAGSEIEIGETPTPGKHDFVTKPEIERKSVTYLPIVLNVGVRYSRKGVLGCSTEIAEAAEPAGGGLRVT